MGRSTLELAGVLQAPAAILQTALADENTSVKCTVISPMFLLHEHFSAARTTILERFSEIERISLLGNVIIVPLIICPHQEPMAMPLTSLVERAGILSNFVCEDKEQPISKE
jgi:hypothetical protein